MLYFVWTKYGNSISSPQTFFDQYLNCKEVACEGKTIATTITPITCLVKGEEHYSWQRGYDYFQKKKLGTC